VDGFQIKWEKSNGNSTRYKLVSERIEERLASSSLQNVWLDAASVGVGAFESGVAVTLSEISGKALWKGALSGTKMLGNHLGYLGGAVAGWKYYDEFASGEVGFHTFLDASVTVVTAVGSGVAISYGAVGVAAGLTVGGFVYGVASAAGGEKWIKENVDPHVNRLQERLKKKIHGLK